MAIKETNIDPEYIRNYRLGLGQKIMSKRMRGFLNQDELADAVGVTPQTIYKIENGMFSPDIDLYIKIALVLNCRVDFL